MSAPTKHKGLLSWVNEVAALCKPSNIHWCDGSEEESAGLFDKMVKAGVAQKLARPNSYLFRTNKGDTARREKVTYICSENPTDAGPLNQHMDPELMRERIRECFTGCMAGRTMYVIPFSMGPIGGPISKIGVQISDSPYVVVNMRIMARIGSAVLKTLGDEGHFVPCLHSVGYPLRNSEGKSIADVTWPCDLDRTFIAHFIDGDNPSIVSFGSGYGGNALLGKKCLALRIASVLGKKEGWLAEHMLICGITDENGSKTYITGAFPSACGKTNLALLQAPYALEKKGWKVTTVGDDIAWLKERNGKLYAINPENGFFGVAPGTSYITNPSAMDSIKCDTIFTNVAYNPETNDVWWEGMTEKAPARLIDWLGQEWTPSCGRLAAHSNSRFTAPLKNCPVLDDKWDDLNGVPISAILYGGRRSTDLPLVITTPTWQSGVYMGATIASESTSAQMDTKEGTLRNDPFAMLPFAGYNMGQYIKHQLNIGKTLTEKPLIAAVNWFRRDEKTKSFLWPGFSENARVLQWIVKRTQGRAAARESPLGLVPRYEDLDWDGLDFSKEQFDKLMHVDAKALKQRTLMNHEELFLTLGDEVPIDMHLERRLLIARL